MGERALGAFQRHLNPNHFDSFAEFAKGTLRANYSTVYEDFLPGAGATLPAPWAKQDTSAAGTPTLDYVASFRSGAYRLTHDATSEAQRLTLYWGDQLTVPASRGWIFECGVSFNYPAAAAFSADQRAVFGMASARNATLDSIVTNAWFRVEGADLSIFTETDDGTTDTDDQDSGLDLVEQTVHKFLIDASLQTQIRFFIDLGAGDGWQECAGAAHNATAWALTDRLQPFFEMQKDAGTELDVLTIEYCGLAWLR